MFNLRLKFVAAVIFVLMAAVIARLGYMQLVMTEYYREEGRKRQIKVEYPPAPRGKIVARDGTVLAEDVPVLSVCMVYRDFSKLSFEEGQNWYVQVARIVGTSPTDVSTRVRAIYDNVEKIVDTHVRNVYAAAGDNRNGKRLDEQAKREARDERRGEYRKPRVLYHDVSWTVAAKAEVASVDLPGLEVGESMERRYPPRAASPLDPIVSAKVKGQPERLPPLAPHVIGYVGKANDKDVDLYRYDYNGDVRKRIDAEDVVGRVGIEAQYDYDLKGSRGELRSIVNVHFQKQMILSDDKPEAGTTITLTIDPAIQAAAERGLAEIFDNPNPKERHPGAAVCVDVHTGEILAMASCPSYNPDTFSEDYAKLADPNGLGKYHPFQNRAIDGTYPMGSTFKIVTTTAGLETNTITPSTVFTCTGVFHLGRGDWRCDATHGSLDLVEAIKRSCNVYFYNVGSRVGGGPLDLWASRYGLGHKTGVDLPGEDAGIVGATTAPGEAVNRAIGQGTIAVTPIQVCRMVAAVANGGKLITPHIYSRKEVPMPDPVNVSASTIAVLRQGLYKVVNEPGGTAYKNGRTDKMIYAGKTGTAEAPPTGDQRGDHAWFAGFAPFDNPEIAFAVVVEHGGFGGTAASPVARAMVEAFADEKLAASKAQVAASPAPIAGKALDTKVSK
jgi:penicillin-binding protein 2